MDVKRYDVCVIGGGLTGLMTARAALANGKTVLMVERGSEYRPHQTDRKSWWKETVASEHDEFTGYVHYRNRFDGDQDYFDDLVQNESGKPPWSFKYNMWYGLGGSAQMWSGLAWRLVPADFKTKSSFGYGFDWPIEYADLEKYYDRAEQFLEVSGPDHSVRKNLKYWPWNNNFTYPHFPLSYLDQRFQDIIGDLGELVPQPHAVRNKPVEDGGCIGAKTCVSYCASKAIFKSGERILPGIIFDSNLEIRLQTAAVRLDWDQGRITGVTCRDSAGGKTFMVEADKYFLCGNAFENVRLIKYSEQQNAKKFGRASRMVGRFFSSHGAVTYTCITEKDVFPVRGRPTHASVIEWVDREKHSRVGGITLEVWNNDFTLGFAPWRHMEEHVKRGHWGGHLFSLVKSFERRFCISMVFETEMTRTKTLSLSPSKVDKFGIPVGRVDTGFSPVDRRTLDRLQSLSGKIGSCDGISEFFRNGRGINGNHPLGGLRMSRSAREGVVNDRCKSHDFDNLYILGGGAFCSTGTFNPTLTIAALAIRAFEDPTLGWNNVPY